MPLFSLPIALAGTGAGLVFQRITLAYALGMVEGITKATAVIMVRFLVIVHFLARPRPAIGAGEA